MHNGVLKNFLKKIYSILQSRRDLRSVFRYAKLFLKRGKYYSPYDSNKLILLDNNYYKLMNFIFSAIYHNKTDGNFIDSPISIITYGVGQGKVVIIANNTAFGFFFTEKGFFNSKKNYDDNYSSFNYPCVKNIKYNYDYKCVKMDCVSGEKKNDFYHNELIISELLKLLITANVRIDSNGHCLFLQHGDVNNANIIWNGESFTFIDLDNIGYYPPLLDVLHFLKSANYSLNEIVSLLNNYISQIKMIAMRSNINIESNYLDEFFCLYVEHYIKINSCFGDFSFLTVDNTEQFPKTNKLLRSIII